MLPKIAVIVFFSAIHTLCSADDSNLLHILAVVSSAERSNSTGTPWTEGEKMLFAARKAAEDINGNPAILTHYGVTIAPVVVQNCDPVRGIDRLLETLQNSSLNVVAVVGMFCDTVARSFSPVLQHWPQSLLVLGSSLRPNMENPNFLQRRMSCALPSHEDAARAVISLLLYFNWTRVGIVHAQTGYGSHAHSNYREAAVALNDLIHTRHRQQIQVGLQYELQQESTFEIHLLLNELKPGGANILVTFLPPRFASAVLTEAAQEGLVWPRLAWVMVHTDPAAVSLSTEWENVILMSFKFQAPEQARHNSKESTAAFTTGDFYGSLMYNSVQAVVSVINGTLTNMPAQQTTGDSNQWVNGHQHNFSFDDKIEHLWSQTQLEVEFVKGNRSHTIGHYSFKGSSLSLNYSLLEPLPPDRFNIVSLEMPKGVFIALNAWISLVYALVVFNFVSFIIFRNEREVKATSVPLSMLMFLGSFLMLSSCILFYCLVVETSGSNSEVVDRFLSCNLHIGLGALGFDLTVTTAAVKTLRIWHIFRYFGRLGKSWTDSRLVCIILALLSVKIFIFLLWIATDTLHIYNEVEFQAWEMPPYFLVVRMCRCKYQAVWKAAGLLNTALLSGMLLVLAVATRKVNRQDFKDTKKTIAMILIQLFLIVSGILLQRILKGTSAYLALYVSLWISFSIGAFIIQVTLFLPKVTPPLGRFVRKKMHTLYNNV